MVVWFKQSLKKLNAAKAEKRTQREEITELQDALMEIAGLVETMAAEAGGTEEDDNG